MISPRDKEALALRIERLMRQRTSDWLPGNSMEFRSMLPDSRVTDPRRKLPTPEHVRSDEFTWAEYRDTIQKCLRMESLISQNRPGSVKRMMHDMMRGRPPGFRR
jgi:hypothetical protein